VRAPPAAAARRRPVDHRLWQRVRAVRPWLVASVGIGLGLTGCLVAQALLLATLLARLFHRPVDLADVEPDLVGLLLATAARSVLLAVSASAGTNAANRVRATLRHDGLAAVLDRGSSWLAGERAGELAVTLGRGLDALDTYVGSYLPRLVLAVLSPVVLLGVIAGLDWLSLLILLAALAVVPVFMVLVGRLTAERVAQRWAALTALGAHFLDAVEGLPILRAYGRERVQEEQIARVTDDLRRTTLAVLRETFLSSLILETLAAVGTALVAVPLALRLLDGRMTLAPALAVLLLTPEVFLPLRRASADFHAATEGLSATDRVFAILDAVGEPARPARMPDRHPAPGSPTPPSPAPAAHDAEPAAATAAATGTGASIDLRGVTVRYAGRHDPALSDVDLAIAPGERVALVGPSGAGKSTLLEAVLGLVQIEHGSITAGGLRRTAAGAEQWGSLFAYVPQRPHFFAGTLADNLRLGSPELGLDELEAAVDDAHLAAVVAGLPRGLDTEIGPGGQRLSTGERQRVAWARALLRHRAAVVVLDEPTAHVDMTTERLLVAALDRALGGRTLVVATHRPRMAALADRVVALDHGRLGGHLDGSSR